MNPLFLVLALTCSVAAGAQEALPPPDSTLLRRIDSLVAAADAPGHTVSRDSVFRDMPEMKISTRTWLTMVTEGTQVLKYVNRVQGHSEIGGVKEELEGENHFYFEKGALIKVDEWFIKNGKRQDLHWYFYKDRPLHYTPVLPKSAERAEQLLQLAKAMQEQWRARGLN